MSAHAFNLKSCRPRLCRVVADERLKSERTRGLLIVCILLGTTFAAFHQTSRVTPAMEANITDHVWELKDLLAYPINRRRIQ